MGSHNNRPDVFQLRLVQSLVLGERHESPVIKVLGNRGWVVKETEDLGRDILREAVGRIPRSEERPVKSIRSESFVKVGGLHCRLHVGWVKHFQRGLCHPLKFLPQPKSPVRVHLEVLSSTIHFLEVFGNSLVHMVTFCDELVLLHHGPHNRVSALDLQYFLRGGVEGLHVTRSEVPCECVQHFMIVELTRELEKLRCLMGFLGRGVSDSLVRLSRLGSILLRDFPRHVTDQGVLIDLRGVLKHAFVEALLDDLPNRRLWESAGVNLLLLILGCRIPLYQRRLHSDLDEAVVGHLVNVVCDYRVEDDHVPRPQLVKLVP